MKRLFHGWIPAPRCDSRTGAAHLRRGFPCQDACGLWMFADAAGDPIQVLVVSDGHGGSRYVRSDVGSRLACDVALHTAAQTLKASRTGQPGAEDEWRQWLAESLPQAIVESWQQAVKRDWQHQGPPPAPASLTSATSDGSSSAPAFSTIPYGATLGLLVLTPRWWGHTGLGDWDLVRIEASGEGCLLSEEPQVQGSGESTYSLCMQGAASHFASRSALQPLASDEPPFSLLMSTDGIRKSCGSDLDYLTLAHYLAELPASHGQGNDSELSSALDHISSQGSGDDVSVVIGRWEAGALRSDRPLRSGRSTPLIVQPAHVELAPKPALVETVAARSDQPAMAPIGVGPAPVRAEPAPRPGVLAGLPRSTAVHSRPWPGVALLVLVALGASVLPLLLAWNQGWGPFAGREPSPAPGLTPMQQQVDQLCEGTVPPAANPPGTDTPVPGPSSSLRSARIRGSLLYRKHTFSQILKGGEPVVQRLLQEGSADPLGALIAWSRTQHSLALGLPPLAVGPSGGQARAAFRWPWQSHVSKPEPLSILSPANLCTELRFELQQQWTLSRSLQAEPASSPPRSSASAPEHDSSTTLHPAGSGTVPGRMFPTLAPPARGDGRQDASMSDSNR